MWAIGLYNSLVILLIVTFKLAGSTPALSHTHDCDSVPREIEEKCCSEGQWVSSRPGCH
ncbi:hypothetical protein PGT21_034301 [Puccinia graminis f. sp. tritici]|uniref:Uncharacterized protein n=1 Tax=Puccinia graminis f. sp. tritici TaxID=56615 RepID=A0A5B0N7E6_PUCGR|nr:hypothetical protein PGTUg99_015600 [Puccinia graminis f. sp. tritici]KAA1084692.1 hypothetical protein PGT21_034301 [Puccinia graminis f. sp. tritici]